MVCARSCPSRETTPATRVSTGDEASVRGIRRHRNHVIEYAPEDEDFTEEVQQLVDGVTGVSADGGPVGIYLTAFAEAAGVLETASASPELESVPCTAAIASRSAG